MCPQKGQSPVILTLLLLKGQTINLSASYTAKRNRAGRALLCFVPKSAAFLQGGSGGGGAGGVVKTIAKVVLTHLWLC